MIPFQLTFQPGAPLYEQVVFAVKKAIVSGQLRSGDAFPSVRALSKALKINPNTAHKVIAELVDEGLLEVSPGIGTAITGRAKTTIAQRHRLIAGEAERLVVEAKKLGMSRDEILDAVSDQWERLGGK